MVIKKKKKNSATWNNTGFHSLADFALLGFDGAFRQTCAWATSRLSFCCKAHNMGTACQAPSTAFTTEKSVLNSWFWTADHLASWKARNRSVKMLRQMGPGSHAVPGGRTKAVWEHRERRSDQDTVPTHGQSHRCGLPQHTSPRWAKSRHFYIKALLSAVKTWHKVTC